LNTCDKEIKEQAYIRLFKTKKIPEHKAKILKLKMPQIINLTFKGLKTNIKAIIKENTNSLLNPEIKKN